MNLPLIRMCKMCYSKWAELSRASGRQDVKQIQEQLETIPWVKGAVVRKSLAKSFKYLVIRISASCNLE